MGLLRRIARARLAGHVIRRLRRAGVAEARYDARAFAVRFVQEVGDPPATVIPLDALMAHRARNRKDHRAEVDRFVAGFLREPGLPGRWADVRPLLRPVLRGAVPMKDISTPLRRPALPFLSEFVVVDQPDTMTYVAVDQLPDWDVTADEVFAAARENLTGAVLRSVATDSVVVQFIDDGDTYWTSHLLLDGWLTRFAEQVGGRPVAFAPERGTLIVTAAGGAHLPELFARAERAYLTSPRAITPMAYVSDEQGHTVPYAVPRDHPLYGCVRRAEAVLAMQEYARQAETLDHAAPLVLARDDVRTRAVWSEGALLPRADEVQIGEEVQPWGDLEARLQPVPGLDPPRFRLG
ncbi:MAG TPA: hypothetical protein VFR35_15690 [Actinoplanes sp.]|nr:hypothetical protein [Actinoplanes sp.]